MSTLEPSAETMQGLRQVFSCIDNTTLEGSDNEAKVEALCRRSIELQDPSRGIVHVAAVCVYPVFVSFARKCLQNSGIKIASVAGGFPAGQTPLPLKLAEVRYALAEGADEIDMVISRGAFLAGDYSRVFDEIAAIREASQGSVFSKLANFKLPKTSLTLRNWPSMLVPISSRPRLARSLSLLRWKPPM